MNHNVIYGFFSRSENIDSFSSIGKLARFHDPFGDITPHIFDNFLPIKAS